MSIRARIFAVVLVVTALAAFALVAGADYFL
jgi:hypothetical protein